MIVPEVLTATAYDAGSPAERQRARAERSIPILDALKAHLEATLARVSGKSPLAKAIRYATSDGKH